MKDVICIIIMVFGAVTSGHAEIEDPTVGNLPFGNLYGGYSMVGEISGQSSPDMRKLELHIKGEDNPIVITEFDGFGGYAITLPAGVEISKAVVYTDNFTARAIFIYSREGMLYEKYGYTVEGYQTEPVWLRTYVVGISKRVINSPFNKDKVGLAEAIYILRTLTD